MTKVTIDNQEYEFESLPEEVKAQLASMRYVDNELQRLQAQAAVLQTARVAYSNAVKVALSGASQQAAVTTPPVPETLEFPQETVAPSSGWGGFFKK